MKPAGMELALLVVISMTVIGGIVALALHDAPTLALHDAPTPTPAVSVEKPTADPGIAASKKILADLRAALADKRKTDAAFQELVRWERCQSNRLIKRLWFGWFECQHGDPGKRPLPTLPESIVAKCDAGLSLPDGGVP